MAVAGWLWRGGGGSFLRFTLCEVSPSKLDNEVNNPAILQLYKLLNSIAPVRETLLIPLILNNHTFETKFFYKWCLYHSLSAGLGI